MNDTVLYGFFGTLLLYLFFLPVYRRNKIIFLHPNIASTAILMAILYTFDTPYSLYYEGAQYISALLGISIVVLAVPLYENLVILMKHLKPMAAASLISIWTSFISIALFSRLFSLSPYLTLSLLPKSITTAMAIEASSITGGSTGAAVLGVMVTGIGGAILGRSLLTFIRVRTPIARGCALGMASHVMGTSQALEEGTLTGAYSALSIPLNGLITILHLPLFQWLIKVLS